MNEILLALEGATGALIMVSAGLLSQLVALVAIIWMTILAVRQSPAWALVVFLIPLLGPCLFAYNFWSEARKPFYVYLGAIGLLLVAVAMFIIRAFIGMYFSDMPIPSEL